MNVKKVATCVTILALLVGTLTLSSYVAAQSESKGPAWEYELVGMRLQPRSVTDEQGKKRLVAAEIQGEFNFHGEAGWEYAGTFPGEEDVIFFVFKRKK